LGIGFLGQFPLVDDPPLGLCVTVKKPERFVRGFFKQVWKSFKKMLPKATLIDFHICGSFHRPPLPNVSFFLLLSLSLQKSGSLS
jgi:hypothetical protein